MMKSIFTRPLFINPQAYSVIPELMLIGKSQPYDFSSDQYVFQVITSGRIEGKLLKAGNEYILHLDLYTIDGNCVLGEFYIGNSSIGNIDDFVLEQSNGFVTIKFGDNGNISYPGLIAAWSAKGKSNDDEDRATLKDLTGNGHDISLNGFAFSEMSGYGGYLIAMNKMWGNNLTYDYKKVYPTYTVFSKTGLFTRFQKGNVLYGKKLRFKVTGIKDNNHWISVNWYHFLTPNLPNKSEKYYGDFEITVPSEEDYSSNADMSPYIAISVSGVDEVCNITIELLPEYPDALVFDGVDDYGSAVDFGGKEIKTVISKYQTLSVSPNKFSLYFKDPLNGNIFQRIRTLKIQSNPSIRAYSDNVTLLDDYCKIDRNTKALTKPFQITGYNRTNEIENIAFYSAYLFDRSLDEQEIKSFIRKYIEPEYLLPSEIPTPDCYYDFSQGSNDDADRNTIKDYSGNGNNAVAHNFAWNEEGSGYKDGALVFDGTDDYVECAYNGGFSTIFILDKLSTGLYDYSQIEPYKGSFNMYRQWSSENFILQNTNGITYINGVKRTATGQKLQNKKLLLTVVNKTNDRNKFVIGADFNGTTGFIKGNVYKFLGFKEALTEEQINAVIKKYNLLDGVDEIEVS